MKRTPLLVFLIWFAVGAWAQQLTMKQSRDRALQYLKAKSPAKTRGLTSAQLKAAKVDAEKIYAFNREGGGFVIASADERTLPVLGYSDSGSIDWEKLPENLRAWLKQYDEAVATLGNRTCFKDGKLLDGDGKTRATTRAAYPAIEPLIKTRWNQEPAPYYNMCPIYVGNNPEWQGQRCITGCVAVTLAQVLNYWQWPKSLPDGLPAYESPETYDASLTWHIDSLPPVTFDWDNMLNEYAPWNSSTGSYDLLGTETQQQAVATLIRYCGQAVNAKYSPVASGTSAPATRDALVNYLGYPAATDVCNHYYVDIDEWEDIVYTELVAWRPIIYSGIGSLGGHTFICDGYDGDGLFHFNWGWQGLCDGYFSLSVLDPYDSTNTNAYNKFIGFTQGQTLIIGIDPSLEKLDNPYSAKLELRQYKIMSLASKNAVTIYTQYNNASADSILADYALGTIETDGTLTPRFIGNPNDSILYDLNNITVEIDSTAFQPGDTLKLYPMVRFRHSPDAQWQLVPPATHYVDAGRSADGHFFITIHPYTLELVDYSITSGRGRIGESCNLTVTLRNRNDIAYTERIRLIPLYYGDTAAGDVTDNTPYTQGDALLCGPSISARQDAEVTFSFIPKTAGLVIFHLGQVVGARDYYTLLSYFANFPMRFDTIYSYKPYLDNNSYITHEGNHYVYHVELCDRPGVTVPHGLPSDSIFLDCCISSGDETIVSRIKITDEIKDYLRALPDSAGNGNYKFTAEVPLDIEQDGEYFAWSYLKEWLNAEHTEFIVAAEHYEIFSVDHTAIKAVNSPIPQPDAPFYDLQGRRVNTRAKGIYIRKGQKYIK